MKDTSLKEYHSKFKPDMSLHMETAWTGRKVPISKKMKKKFFWLILPVHA
jgi:hypothetical protein